MNRFVIGAFGAAAWLGALLAMPTISVAADTPAAASAPKGDWQNNPVATVEGITEYRLPNGLRVLLFPDQSSSNVTVNITYFVGSRQEGRGEKGMAHLLEHMVFKGTPNHVDPWKSLQEHGANFNGTTWTDRTNYYETMVASDENLEFALRMEADRMVNSFISAEALAKEMSVVRNEFEMGENNPFGILMKELFAKAYVWHPYRDSTIGNRSDIERVPADNLRAFYKHYYRPANSMLVVAGKFDPKSTLELINKYFASIPNPPEPIVDTWTDEPVQDGPRYVEVRREGTQASVGALYHTPAGSHPDATAATILGQVLGARPSGRLYKALVEGNLAAAVTVLPFGMAERGQFMIIATLKEGQDPAAALAKMEEVVEGFAANPVTDEEVERARAAELSQIKIAMTDSNRIGVELTESASLGDWRLFFINRDRIKAITTPEVQEAAVKYLVENNRTSARFSPTKSPIRAEIPAKPEIAPMVENYKGTESVSEGETFDPTPANIESRVKRTKLGENIQLATLNKQTRGEAVNVALTVRFGDEKSLAGKRVPGELLASLLRRGTTTRTFQQISDELDKIQSTVGISSSAGAIRVNITSDQNNLGKAVEIASDMLRNPSFPQQEFDTIQKERLAGVEASVSDPRSLAQVAIQRALAPFPKDSFNYVPTVEERLAELKAVTLEDVKDLYKKQVGPSSVQIAAVGQFDDSTLNSGLAKLFDGWVVRAPFTRIDRPFIQNESGTKIIITPDKPMAVVGMATSIEMQDTNPDAPAIEIGGYMLGGGAKNRMSDRLRQKEGLSYGAGANIQSSPLDPVTTMAAFAICAKQNAAKAAAAMQEEVTRWIESGVDEKELTEARKSYRLEFLSELNEDNVVAGMLASGLYLNRTMKWDADRLDQIESLSLSQVNDSIKKKFSGVSFFELQAGDLQPAEPPVK
ncbi:MAG: insulinase family protein [Phycisphaeraceae bacterium]|nr:insulinase family protein [Phycisphaeraceae bacterium]